jgi:hypothetical protein
MGSYQKQAALGLIGAGLIVSPLFIRLPGRFSVFNQLHKSAYNLASESAKIRASEDLERFKIDQRKQTADILNKSGMLPSGDKLKIRGYFYNPHKDPNPEVTGFLESDRVWVYDSAGVCIGLIEERTWKWKKYYPPICSKAPAM